MISGAGARGRAMRHELIDQAAQKATLGLDHLWRHRERRLGQGAGPGNEVVVAKHGSGKGRLIRGGGGKCGHALIH